MRELMEAKDQHHRGAEVELAVEEVARRERGLPPEGEPDQRPGK